MVKRLRCPVATAWLVKECDRKQQESLCDLYSVAKSTRLDITNVFCTEKQATIRGVSTGCLVVSEILAHRLEVPCGLKMP